MLYIFGWYTEVTRTVQIQELTSKQVFNVRSQNSTISHCTPSEWSVLNNSDSCARLSCLPEHPQIWGKAYRHMTLCRLLSIRVTTIAWLRRERSLTEKAVDSTGNSIISSIIISLQPSEAWIYRSIRVLPASLSATIFCFPGLINTLH